MNEYIILFASLEAVRRAGLSDFHVTAVGQLYAMRLRDLSISWQILRECVSYAQTHDNGAPNYRDYTHYRMRDDDYSQSELHHTIQHAVRRNLPPIQINQW